MGKLLEALKRKKAEIDKKRQGKAPNVMEDPAAALQFQKQLADAEFLETRMARGITASLKQMTPEQQDAFYDSCISEERKNAYARNDFHEALDNDWTDFISDGGKFGQDWEKTVSSFEKMISAEENEALAWEVDQLKLPSDPTYPKELRYTNPYKDAIAAQRNLIRDDDPDAAKKKEILDRADEVLLNGSEDTLQNLNRIYTHFSTPKTAGIDAQMDLVGDLQTVNYLDKTLENGRYKNKFPTKVVDGERRYKCQEIDPATTDLTDADIRDLRKTKMDLSPKTVNTVLSVMEKMNKIIDREYPEADRETLLVLDATTGKNAISQAKEFNESAKITGIVLTKLDGTAKGGIAITVTDEFNIPIKFIGVGEKLDDLQQFIPRSFAGSIFM